MARKTFEVLVVLAGLGAVGAALLQKVERMGSFSFDHGLREVLPVAL